MDEIEEVLFDENFVPLDRVVALLSTLNEDATDVVDPWTGKVQTVQSASDRISTLRGNLTTIRQEIQSFVSSNHEALASSMSDVRGTRSDFDQAKTRLKALTKHVSAARRLHSSRTGNVARLRAINDENAAVVEILTAYKRFLSAPDAVRAATTAGTPVVAATQLIEAYSLLDGDLQGVHVEVGRLNESATFFFRSVLECVATHAATKTTGKDDNADENNEDVDQDEDEDPLGNSMARELDGALDACEIIWEHIESSDSFQSHPEERAHFSVFFDDVARATSGESLRCAISARIASIERKELIESRTDEDVDVWNPHAIISMPSEQRLGRTCARIVDAVLSEASHLVRRSFELKCLGGFKVEEYERFVWSEIESFIRRRVLADEHEVRNADEEKSEKRSLKYVSSLRFASSEDVTHALSVSHPLKSVNDAVPANASAPCALFPILTSLRSSSRAAEDGGVIERLTGDLRSHVVGVLERQFRATEDVWSDERCFALPLARKRSDTDRPALDDSSLDDASLDGPLTSSFATLLTAKRELDSLTTDQAFSANILKTIARKLCERANKSLLKEAFTSLQITDPYAVADDRFWTKRASKASSNLLKTPRAALTTHAACAEALFVRVPIETLRSIADVLSSIERPSVRSLAPNSFERLRLACYAVLSVDFFEKLLVAEKRDDEGFFRLVSVSMSYVDSLDCLRSVSGKIVRPGLMSMRRVTNDPERTRRVERVLWATTTESGSRHATSGPGFGGDADA